MTVIWRYSCASVASIASHGEFWAAGDLLGIMGHLLPCYRVSPRSCFRAKQTCASNIAIMQYCNNAIRLHCSMQVDQVRERGLGSVCAATAELNPPTSSDSEFLVNLPFFLPLESILRPPWASEHPMDECRSSLH